MQKLHKRATGFLLAVFVLAASIPFGGVRAEAAGGDLADQEYEIYPVPREITYEDGMMELSDAPNLVIEDTIDQATKDRLKNILADKDAEGTVSDGLGVGETNILVGTKGSGGFVDGWFDTEAAYDAALFDKVDAYTLAVKDDVIAVLGKDTDAAFYGLSTLKMIFEQSEGRSIRKLTIEDYASGQYRGFIEGYYGIPWSVDDRISLMEFGGDFKMNIYIFAPKDDPYHNTHWREPYPQEDLANIERMVAAGAAAKCRFAWAIHPFMNDAITMADYDAGLEAIQTKFQQLYDAGVRQFVLSADDASSQVTLQAKLCEDMTKWVKSKGDCYNLVFVPQVYCTSAVTWSNWGGSTVEQYFSYFKDIEDLEIMWTGEWVCHPASQNTITNFKNKTGGKEAFMWLNWPVNDVNHARLVMGPAETGILEPGLTDFKGLVTNPLEQAEASKTSLFAIADFAWNTTDFSCFTSWENGFKYIEPGAPEAMHELCKHLTNPRPGGITSMGESTELEPYITAFTNAYDNGNGTDYAQEAADLTLQLEKIVEAADDFQENGTNVNLQDEMKPWVDSLRYLAKACISFIRTAEAISANDADSICSNYLSAVNNYRASQGCEAPQLSGTIKAEAGAVRIMPFAALMSNSVKEEAMAAFNADLGSGEAGETGEASLIYDGLGGFYQGDASKITDGDDTTFAWFNNNVSAGAYIGLDLGDVYKLDQIHILQGNSSTNGDIFSTAVLEYSMDNDSWTEIDTYSANDIEVNVLDQAIEARYVRLRTPSDTNKWYAIREFSVTTRPVDVYAYTNAEAYKEHRVTVDKTSASVLGPQGDIVLKKGEYIGLEFPCAKEIVSLKPDYTKQNNLSLECSYNGFDWTEAKPSCDAKYIRIMNKADADVTFRLNELSVEYKDGNRTLVASPEGREGHESSKAADNSIVSSFMAAEGSGSLTWRIDGKPVDELYILQDQETISNANVSVRTNTKAWVQVGTLSGSRNVFDLAKYGAVNEVKISWEKNGPTIYEMYTKTGEHTSTELLQAAVDFAKTQKNEGFSEKSYAAFTAALAAAEQALKKPGITEGEAAQILENLYKVAAELKTPDQEPADPDKGKDPSPGPAVTETLKKGYTETVKDLKYRVTNAEKKEVAVYGVKSKKLKKLTIPAEVKLKNGTCKVTGIAGKAFSGMKSLTSVTIGKNVKEIGSKAFYQDKKLSKVTVKGTVLKKVAKDAFKKAKNKGTVKVPKSRKKAYAKLFKKATKMKVK